MQFLLPQSTLSQYCTTFQILLLHSQPRLDSNSVLEPEFCLTDHNHHKSLSLALSPAPVPEEASSHLSGSSSPFFLLTAHSCAPTRTTASLSPPCPSGDRDQVHYPHSCSFTLSHCSQIKIALLATPQPQCNLQYLSHQIISLQSLSSSIF